jgi:hypothetical protein
LLLRYAWTFSASLVFYLSYVSKPSQNQFKMGF